jgi:AraC-like DNA-binding protein
MDPLTDILTGLSIRTASYTRLDATAPWGLHSPGERGINFVLVLRGSAILTVDGREPIALRGGDLFIMLDDTPYRLVDHEDSAMIACVDVEKLRVNNRIGIGGGGALTTFVGGAFEIDALAAQPLLKALPALLYLQLDMHRSLAFQSVLEMLALETESPGLGSAAVISRLFELLLVHAIRAYTQLSCGPKTQGWLAALADRHLALALQAMHAAPAQDWTVETLARAAGMSRSSFAARFKAVVGQTPLDYLTQWRMYHAARLLRQDHLALSEVAREVGYESVAAFNRVFRRETAMTPGAFRKAGATAVSAFTA